MRNSDLRKAERLVSMANESMATNGISYVIDKESEPKRVYRSVWYPVVATDSKGNSWSYWLAADSGSWRGSFN